MNLEQVEGQLAEFEGKPVSVTLPIRGSVCIIFGGDLKIEHDWENHIISYQVGFNHCVHFEAKDVESIAVMNDMSTASVVLKSDAPMEKSKFSHS
jgi:hypothetical protein